MTSHCCAAQCQRFGRSYSGGQKYRCKKCLRIFSERRRTIGNMYLPFETSVKAVNLLVEGNSIRSTARLMDIERNTVISLLANVGRDCSDFLCSRIRNVDISHLEIDEIWTFVYKKQKRVTAEDPNTVGDAYCYIALDRASRLIVAWHLGKRDAPNTASFILKVRRATSRQRFQISSDGWEAYEWAIEAGLSDRADYARIVKVTQPGRVEPVLGNPDLSQTETTYIERCNGTLRQWNKRFTRKTYAFSKDWDMLEAALALHFAWVNFCCIHNTLRITPAMAAGLASHPWTLSELLEKACL